MQLAVFPREIVTDRLKDSIMDRGGAPSATKEGQANQSALGLVSGEPAWWA
jgi:hypothetical protein